MLATIVVAIIGSVEVLDYIYSLFTNPVVGFYILDPSHVILSHHA